MKKEELQDRFRGTLVGQALGDACGFPLEGLPASRCRRQASPAVAGKLSRSDVGFSFGQYTDDTQMALAITRSIIANQAIVPGDAAQRFAALWAEGQIVGQGLACREAVKRIINGVHWDLAGAPEGRAGNGAAMRTAPIGLFCYRDPETLFQATDQIARITHRDQRARAGAVAVSFALAHLVSTQTPSPSTLIPAITPHVSRLHVELADLLNELLLLRSEPEDKVISWIYSAGFIDEPATGWDGITPYVISTVLGSIYAFFRHPADYLAAIRLAISMGGDVDTTAAITGALVGSVVGLKGLPPDLAKKVNDRGRNGYQDIISLADSLFKITPIG